MYLIDLFLKNFIKTFLWYFSISNYQTCTNN